jgi:hypothetical protein
MHQAARRTVIRLPCRIGKHDLLNDFVRIGIERFGPGVQGELENYRAIVSQLCEPDPLIRGHPLNRMGAQDRYSLNRYISMLAAIKARLRVKSA